MIIWLFIRLSKINKLTIVANTMNDKSNSTTDDFLKEIEGTDFLESNKQEVTKNPEVSKPEEVHPVHNKIPFSIESTDTPPDLEGSDFPPEFIRIVDTIKKYYSTLPHLNYDDIYKEIADLTIISHPTPTLEVLNDELFRVQASMSRLSQILLDVIKCYNFKKRAVDILKDAWGKFTAEKNTEGRKGDAIVRTNKFMMDFAATESLMKACDHIFKNLDGLQDNLSRRITIFQLTLKMREGQMALPDLDFGRDVSGNKLDELFDAKDEEKSEDGAVKLRDF